MDDRYIENGERLARLIIDKGTEAMRKVFDSIHSPATLPTILWHYHASLKRLHVINCHQMNILFPTIPWAPSTSEDYDITLLFTLLRNICGLRPPATTGSWAEFPPPTDLSQEADLTRIKYYRNVIYGHNSTIGINDIDFQSYWDHISGAVIRLGVNVDEIKVLKTGPLEEKVDLQQLKNWKEEENLIEVLVKELQDNQTKLQEAQNKMQEAKDSMEEHKVLLDEIRNWQQKVEESQNKVRKNHNRLHKGQNNLLKDQHKLQEVRMEFNGVANLMVKLTMLLLLVVLLLIVTFSNSRNLMKQDQASFALDFSSHLNISNSDFVGRKWFFQQLEHAVNNSRPQSTGVIILGDPGSGKSAIMSQLISSPSSSPFIHKNIIGFHVCKFDEVRTRDGMRLVHALVQQLAKNIPEYFNVIQEPAIQYELKSIHCKDDPIGCFVTTILHPIKELKGQENTTKFILIDALDECLWKYGNRSAVVTIFKNKMTGFPAWIKLIISSRNKKSLIAKLPTFEKLVIDSTDQRNLEDIRSYVEHVMLRNDSFITEPDKKYVKSWISKHVNIVNGVNFLHVITLLQYGAYNQSQDYIPPTLDSLYGSSFRDRFEKKDFESFTPLFEVLLASNSPTTMTNLEAVLKIRKDTYDIRRAVTKISEYLIIDSNGTVRFYHQSFANWLMNQTEDCDDLYIQISRGHQYIVDYLFDYFHKRNTILTLEELFELSMHVLLGEMKERQVRKIQGLNVSEIRDPVNGECILHKLARERNSTPIIKIFLKFFDSIDIFTKFGRLTPLCYAASSGNFENLKLFIDNGADVNSVFNSYYFVILKISEKGDTKTAKLLINNGVDFDKKSMSREKPLWRAVWYGHLDFVKLLVNEGVKPDVIALHRAARRDHSDIVRFLLDRGIRDVCLECKPGDRCLFPTALHTAVFCGHLNIVKLLLSYGKDTLECKDHFGQTPLMLAAERDHSDIVRFLLDRGIRDVCNLKCKPSDRCLFPTALHAAVSRSHLNIVKLLLSYGNDTLECKDFIGRTPLLRAAERNHSDIVRFLLNRGIRDVCLECKPSDRCLFPTALHAAVSRSHLNIVKLLLSYGNDTLECKDFIGRTPLLRAARRNHSDIVRFLLNRGIRDVCLECKPSDRCLFPTALHAAVSSGHLNIVKLLLSYGKDTLECKDRSGRTPLLRAAEKNHSDIVRFLLNRGIRDVCNLECKPGDDCLFPTALHAAVSRRHLNIVKLLLSYGKDTLECKDFSGRTPLLRAAKRNDTEIATLLLNNGANTEAKCRKMKYFYKGHRHLSHIRSYAATTSSDKLNRYPACVTRSIHPFANRRWWKMVKELVFRWNANPGHDIIHNFNDKYAGKIIENTALRSTAVCGSPKTLSIANGIANSSIFQTVYKDGTTLLHLAANWSAYPATRTRGLDYWESCTEHSYVDTLTVNKNHFTLQNVNGYKNEYKKHLMTVRLLTKLQNINKTDKYGRTALHYAAARGFAGAVRHLVRQGSDWKIKDQSGDTPLELALKKSPPRPRYFLPCRMTSDGVFQSCTSTMFDETVRYLIMVQKSTIKKCNTDTKRLLYTLIKKNMPLSLYNLFKIGVDVNCGVALKMQLNISKLRSDEISEVFKIFEVDVNVECDVPFNRSELHLMAYLGMPNYIGSFFKLSVNNRSFPLQRFINNHPNGFRVLDECRDKEGYLAIHRAAQGGNFDAVSWFMSLGVDIFKQTRSGWDALYLSMENLMQYSYDDTKIDYYGERIVAKLLEQSVKTIRYKFSESTEQESTELFPPHIFVPLAMKIVSYDFKLTRKLIILSTSKWHEIKMFYLTHLYISVATLKLGNNLLPLLDLPYEGRYPEREVEYHLIYNHFFQTPEVDLTFELDFEGLFKCPGMNELLPKRKKIEGRIEQCNNQCWKSTSQVIRNFLSAFPYIVIENASFDMFRKFIPQLGILSELRYHTVKLFYKIPSRFWRQVSEAYSCSYSCRCVKIMQLLQETFTSQPKNYSRVGEFVAERMGWKDTSTDGNVLDRWPFRFLLKKALKKDKDYEDLKIWGGYLEYSIPRGIEYVLKYFYEILEQKTSVPST